MRRWRWLLGVLGTATLVLSACSDEPSYDREAAIAEVLALDPRLERSQAECYVDRTVEELGVGAVPPGSAPPELVDERTAIRVDCIGVASLGVEPTVTAPLPEGTVRGPQQPGDDPELDALYTACQAGSGLACDRLFEAAPVGSVYEEFGSTCGDRTRELSCAAVYPDPPGVSAPPAPSLP